jgi:hypothetical protein
MANSNPTDGGKVVPLDLTDAQLSILRETISTCLGGVRDDLKAPDEAVNVAKAGQEADAYERLLRSLAWGEVVVPDEAARAAIETMAIAADEESNYAEVIANHDALFGLLDRLGGIRVERVGGEG